jgi:hypothetical protein
MASERRDVFGRGQNTFFELLEHHFPELGVLEALREALGLGGQTESLRAFVGHA